MGKPTASADEQASNNPSSITHFSHPHPLHLLNPQSLGQLTLHCSACMLDASTASAVHACITCNFALHPKCSQLPQQIRHPFDEKHALTLYPKPVYPEGLFNCDACAHRGAGFSYHCSPCGIDLHTTCASLPLKYAHFSHHHPLTLTFSAPYAGNSFSCDLCKKLGSKTWLYSCPACEFDVHLTCVAVLVPPPAPMAAIARSLLPTHQPRPPNAGAYAAYAQQPVAGQFGQNTSPAGMAPPPPQQAYGNANQPAVYGNTNQPAVYGNANRPAVCGNANQPAVYGNANQPAVYGSGKPVNGMGNQVVLAAVEGIAGGVAQSATQALLQGVFGGGGGGGGGGGLLDVMGITGGGGGGGVIIDGGSCDNGATDGGYSAEDGSY